MSVLRVATAGHVDHGKSALVRVLTGTDPDRLPEEKRRRISIVLGFAHLDLPQRRVVFVDVPGHERFVSTMIAGARGVDAAFLVVAADEGVMPQTREHLRILRWLHIAPAGVLFTRCDLADAATLEMARAEVADLVADSPWADIPVIACSAVTGAGLDAVREVLQAFPARGPEPAHRRFRLAVDRAFTLRGHGTVVTGAVDAGVLQAGQAVRILPGGAMTRVRSMEAQGEKREVAAASERAALNLADVPPAACGPGHWITDGEEPALRTTRLVLVRLLPGSAALGAWPGVVTLHCGTAHTPARASVIGDSAALLRFARPVLAFPGDRVVIRRHGPAESIAGAVVLANRRPRGIDPAVWLSAFGDADPAGWDAPEHLQVLLREQPERGVRAARWARRTGLDPAALARAAEVAGARALDGGYFDGAMAARAQQALLADLMAWHRAQPDHAGPSRVQLWGTGPNRQLRRALLDALLATGHVTAEGNQVRMPDHRPLAGPEVDAAAARLVAALDASGFMPESPESCWDGPPAALARVLDRLVQGKELEKLPGFYVTRARWDGLVTQVRACGPGALLSVDQMRAFTGGASRKFLIPLLTHLDGARVTRREGDLRRVLP